jgi:hypothetical protein
VIDSATQLLAFFIRQKELVLAAMIRSVSDTESSHLRCPHSPYSATMADVFQGFGGVGLFLYQTNTPLRVTSVTAVPIPYPQCGYCGSDESRSSR